MIIANSAVQLTASHEKIEHHQRREELTYWRDGEDGRRSVVHIGQQSESLRFEAMRVSSRLAAERLTLSDAGKALLPTPVEVGEAELSGEADAKVRFEMSVLQQLVERITGRRMRLFDASELKPKQADGPHPEHPGKPGEGQPERAGFGLRYDYYESHYEAEKTEFKAAGEVTTADGRQIKFDVKLRMSREFLSETAVQIRAGDALKDPLVVNFDGTAAELGEPDLEFDLDRDGRSEQISFVKPGSGFLALDKNGDGVVNDGGELFGPTSGDGFAELSAYDDDGNQWIDEADGIYDSLRIWLRDGSGNEQLVGLGAKGVGAIYLGGIATPFELNDADNNQLGQVAESSVFLKEDGGAGTIQQVDLVV